MSKNKVKAAAKQAQKAETKVSITPEQAKNVLAEMVGETKVMEALGSDATVIKAAAATETPKTESKKPPVEAKADAKPAEKKAEAPVEVWWEYPGLKSGLSYENLGMGQVVWGLKNLVNESPTVFAKHPREFVVMKMTVLAKTGPLFEGEKQPDFSGVWNLPVVPREGEDGKEIQPKEVEMLLLGDGREDLMAYVGEVVDPWLVGNVVFDFTDAGKADAEAMAKYLTARGRGIALLHNIAQLKRDAILSTSNVEKLTEFLTNCDQGSIWRAKTVFDGLIGETDEKYKPTKFPKGLDRGGAVKELLTLRSKINADNLVAYNKLAKELHAKAVEERKALDAEWKVPEDKRLGESETPVEVKHRRDEAERRAKVLAERAAKAAEAKSSKAKSAEAAKAPSLEEMRKLVAEADAKAKEAALNTADKQAEAMTKHTAKQAVKDAVKVITAQK